MELHTAAHVVGEAAAVAELRCPGQDVLPVAGDGSGVLHPQASALGVIGSVLHPVVSDDVDGEAPQLMEDALGVPGPHHQQVVALGQGLQHGAVLGLNGSLVLGQGAVKVKGHQLQGHGHGIRLLFVNWLRRSRRKLCVVRISIMPPRKTVNLWREE